MQLHQLTLQNYKKYTITKRKTVKNIEIMKKKAIIMVADGLPKVFKDKRMIQKVLFLFRASPFAPVRGGKYLESELSDIRRHTPSRLPDGRLKRNKIKKPPLAVKKARLFAGTKTATCGGPTHFIPLFWCG
ncbi:MAG TPA: hypothetical protein DCL18_08355 [Prevotella sp.]|nr:hypothetical protein [Prevotella sp.]